MLVALRWDAGVADDHRLGADMLDADASRASEASLAVDSSPSGADLPLALVD
jgi:hypothetical protein